MPVEVAILSSELIPFESVRQVTEAIDSSLGVSEERSGGVVEVTGSDGECLLTLGRARVLETQSDAIRVLKDESTVPVEARYLYEALVPYQIYEQGLAVLFSLGELFDAEVVLRGVKL